MEPLQNLNHIQMVGEIKKLIEKFPTNVKNVIDRAINIALKFHWEDKDREEELYVNHIIRTMLRCLLLELNEPYILTAAVLRKIPKEKSGEFIEVYAGKKVFDATEETKQSDVAFDLLMEMFDFKTCNLIRQTDLVFRIIEAEENEDNSLLDQIKKNSKKTKLFLLAVLSDEIKQDQEKSANIIKLGNILIEDWDEKNNQYLYKPELDVTKTALCQEAGGS